MLVFFDDILIYNPSFTQHFEHLRIAFQVLRFNRLRIKKSKCAFAQMQVEYLGYVISSVGVSIDPKKKSAMLSWLRPGNVRSLRGFFGLTDYYRRFVKNYGVISKPLSDLLKKDNFKWDEGVEAAFGNLKQTMSKVPILSILDFNKPFTLETDASGTVVGVVLSQDGRPLAFMSQALTPRHQGLSTYDKELLAVLMAVEK